MCRRFLPAALGLAFLTANFAAPTLAGPAGAAVRPWRDYRTIMWIGDTVYHSPQKFPLFFQRLQEMGINTAMVYGDGEPQPALAANFPYYVENLVNRGLCLKFSSNVRDWDKTVTDWAHNGRPDSALVRDYCLDDPHWLNWALETVEGIVRKNAPHQPLAYNLRDELSTTISANPFDYDFNPIALAQFRTWLRSKYPDLDALNAEWQTRFTTWEEVMPFTTDRIKSRMATGQALPAPQPDWQALERLRFSPHDAPKQPTRWNFAPWADFRSYMDLSLARTLESLRETAHRLDPRTPVGIEGTQMPDAFGGYDLWRLSQVLDWVEPYDIGCAREIFGSFMPGKPILTTVFESETRAAARRLWHLLLEGDRGCLIWWSEDCLDWKNPDWPLTAKARALAPVLREMTSPLAALFLRAAPERDPVFIHYSQASIQADWLLESTVDGSSWLRRFSSFEAEHNQLAKSRAGWLKALQDLGYSPEFLSSAQLEGQVLAAQSNAVLVLPESLAISDLELAEIDRCLALAKPGGTHFTVVAEGPCGSFDGHARFRSNPLSGWLSVLETNTGCIAIDSNALVATVRHSRDYLEERLTKGASPWVSWLAERLGSNSLPVSVPAADHVRVHRFGIRQGRLVAFERNINYQMSEDLKQAGGNRALETPVETEAILREPANVYDLRTGKFIGLVSRFRFNLDPWEPALFALLREPVTGGSLVAELSREQ